MTALNAETREALRLAVDRRRRAPSEQDVAAKVTPPDPWQEADRYTRRKSRAAARRLVEQGPADAEIAVLARKFRARCCPYSGLSDLELNAHALAAATAAVMAKRRPIVPWGPA